MPRPHSIVPVRGEALEHSFVELPFRLYRNDPLWVPPLRSDMRRNMSAQHNPFFHEAEIEHFLALDARGVAVGRISASIHHAYNQRFGATHAFFGLLEMEDDPQIAAALLGEVEAWARTRGKTCITGPYSYTSSQDAALLIDNLDGRPPSVLQTYNPAYYRTLLEQVGYTLAFTFSTFGGPMPAAAGRRGHAVAERVRARHKITVRSATRSDLNGNLDEIRRLFNDSFSNNPEVVALSAPVFRFAIDSVRPFIDLQGIRVIDVDGQASAFFLILPDLNEVLTRLRGRLGLLGMLRLPSYRRKVKKAVIALIGSTASAQGSGLGRVLAEEIHRYVHTRYEEVHTMWIDDRNPFSFVLAHNAGLPRTKRYGVFRKVLSKRSELLAATRCVSPLP